MIGLHVYCKRTRPRRSSDGDGNGMHDDDACEKYELNPTTDEKENVLLMEEKGLSNKKGNRPDSSLI